jgi:hypothetical protein
MKFGSSFGSTSFQHPPPLLLHFLTVSLLILVGSTETAEAMKSALPEEVRTYLDELVKRVAEYLGDELVGIYLFGSAGYQAFEPGQSDLDVQAVVREPLSIEKKQAIVEILAHRVLPCPATKLEFVVYAHGSVSPASRHPRFELNINTGGSQDDHVSFDPADESSHWFLLDIAMGRETGRSLYGPPPTDTFAPIPVEWTLEAIADSLEWHRANEFSSANSVLNACRGWRFAVANCFGSKLAGAAWALEQDDCPSVVKEAIAARSTGEKLPAADVLHLYDVVVEAVQAKQHETTIK